MSDEAARASSLDPARSILLQAPAGSGKTTVLAQRFLSLMAVVDEPEEIIAITFTRKAAAEMRERVLQALQGELDSASGTGPQWCALRERVNARAAVRDWPLEELAARLRIQTIDSLNHEIARSMPVLGRFQASLQVMDDAKPLYSEAARRALRALDEAPDPAVDRLLLRLDNDAARAAELLAQLLAGRLRWLPALVQQGPDRLAGIVQESLGRIADATLADLLRLPADFREEALGLARASSAHREAAGHEPGSWQHWLSPDARLGGDRAHLPAWRALADLALRADGELRRIGGVNVKLGFPPSQKQLKQRFGEWLQHLDSLPDAVQRLQGLRMLPPPDIPQGERAIFATLGRVLLQAVAELKVHFAEVGRVDHAEVASLAREALVSDGAATEQAIRTLLRVRHVLVDEFQDVSPDQLRLLEILTLDWSPGDGRSLFAVGDPMQSIYLFRNAEVGLFLRARDRGIGPVQLESLQLTRNFRSQSALVAWANLAFARVFPPAEDVRRSAVAFLPSVAARDAADDPAVTVWSFAGAREAEAARIAEEIATLRAQQGGAEARRPSIAVLVRDRSLAPPVIDALKSRGISVLGVDLAPLSTQGSVRDLVSLGAALRHAGDRTAWLGVLRAPFCGLSLSDLHDLCADPDALLVDRMVDEAVLAQLSQDARMRLARCAPILREAWQQRGGEALDAGLRRLWLRLGGRECCGESEREAAEQFLMALHAQLEQDPQLDGAGLLELAERLRDARPPAMHGRNPPDVDAVEIMTIHHAKGLEWDVVFVPGLDKRSRGDETPLMRWLELPAQQGGDDLLLSVYSIGAADAQDPLSQYIHFLQRERVRNERARLTYVAATRARQRLYLSGHARANPGELPRPAAGSLLDTLWPALQADFPAPSGTAREERERLPTPQWRRAGAGFDPARHLPVLPAATSMASQAEVPLPRPEFDWVGPAARAAGTLVHQELESWGRSGSLRAPDQRMDLYRRRLGELGVAPADREGLARQIASRLDALRADQVAQWVLDGRHSEAHCELRLSGLVDGRLQHAIIDRSFISDGTRWIIDYKTSTHAGGGREEFIASELERYRPQLQRYRQLAQRMGSQPVRVALYFPWLGELREAKF